MSISLVTLLSFSGAASPTAYTSPDAKGAKAYLGRLETWDFQVTVGGPTGAKVKFQVTSDDPDGVAPAWADMISEVLSIGVPALEHVLPAGTYQVRVRTYGTLALRPLAIINGAPDPADLVTVACDLPLAGI